MRWSARRQVERDLRRGTNVPIHERRLTFGEYYDRWRARRRVSDPRLHRCQPGEAARAPALEELAAGGDPPVPTSTTGSVTCPPSVRVSVAQQQALRGDAQLRQTCLPRSFERGFRCRNHRSALSGGG